VLHIWQGWLKAVNPAMGGTLVNGTDTTEAFPVAQDVMGYSSIGDTTKTSSILAALNTNAAPLFNGNIAAMAANLPKFGSPRVYNYHYDQLNRLVNMDAYTGLSPTSGTFTPVSITDYKESVAYDPNGNIRTYLRNGDAARTAMDNLSYTYNSGTNQLNKVSDAAADATTNYSQYNDLRTGQPNNNYRYDAIGNLVADSSEGISRIDWTVYGKINYIVKSADTIRYGYDAAGNRIMKQTPTDTTFYVRDASGNVLSVYTKPAGGSLAQTELHLYGSCRLDMLTQHQAADSSFAYGLGYGMGLRRTFTRGEKLFELSNHLGNVLVTISDRRLQNSVGGVNVNTYSADVISANDYYPFGMPMPGRKFTAGSTTYRYGFNGKEMDNEVKGTGNQQDYGMRIYDPRIGKFLSVDPLTRDYPELTPYQFASNTPIWAIDLDGLEGLANTGVGVGQIITPENANKVAHKIIDIHRQGVVNLQVAQHAKEQAIKQGRKDGDGINWLTLTAVYIAPWWNRLAPWSDANDGAVLLQGKNLDGTKANAGDYTAAGIGVVIPFVSGSSIKKALKGVGGELLEAFVKKTNNQAIHLTEMDVKGAIKDIFGTPVVINGRTYDHLKEVEEALSGLGRELDKLNKNIDAGKMNGEVLEEAKRLRTKLQGEKDKIQNVLNKARNEANNN
jgi:RHS repeat-associated protein